MTRKKRDPTALERAATEVLAEVKAEDESEANGKAKKKRRSAEPDDDAPRPNGAAHPTNLIPFILKDDGNAERFLAMHRENICYVDEFNSWMAWDGKRWVKDRIQKAKRLAKECVREFLRQTKLIEDEELRENCEGYARISHNRALIHSMLDLAQPEALIQPKQLNTDNYLLNCESGTVNLKTGELLPYRREDYITKMVNYRYNKDAPHEKWLNFLEGITGGGPDVGEGERDKSEKLIAFLQVALGYSVTGETKEKAIFVLEGRGDNGKTTLLSIVRALFSEYSAGIPLEMLTAKENSNAVGAAKAGLMGARFVVSSETEEGQQMLISRLKQICQGQGGMIQARWLRENPFEFPETHKLWIDANHLPDLSGDDALFNRLFRVSLDQKFTDDGANGTRKKDPKLRETLLREEAEGIIAWIIEGAIKYCAEGLPKPDFIVKATEQWRASEKWEKEFMDECSEECPECLKAEKEPDFELDSKHECGIQNTELIKRYVGWCRDRNQRPVGPRQFADHLKAAGYQNDRNKRGIVWPKRVLLRAPAAAKSTSF
jgi:putative DNA primase/helicase